MHSILILFSTLSLLFAKDINHKVQSIKKDATISSFARVENDSQINELRTSREDTTTIWFEDFEGDVSDWVLDSEWELTEESSSSPSHSMHFDDDNRDAYSIMISPTISLPVIDGENELLKFNFDLWCDMPDWFGALNDDGNTLLGDYFAIDIANLSEVPIYFSPSTTDAYDGQSWWCADPSLGTYNNAWLQALESPEVLIPEGATLSAMMKWDIEDYSGAAIEESCTDGWDAANVRISTDGGTTWSLLVGDDPYDFDYGFGWIYNDPEYDCGGSLESLAAGWGGQAPWHEVIFDLASYAGENAMIQFVFGADPSVTATGLKIDDIKIAGSDGVIAFQDNADDQVFMTPNHGGGIPWVNYAYSYGDIDRPGALGWETYPEGASYNVDLEFIQLDISQFAGSDIAIRFIGRTDNNDYTDETETVTANGSGLFFDDLHVWKVSLDILPTVQNLNIEAGDGTIHLTWNPIGGGGGSEELSYDTDDGSGSAFENGIFSAIGIFVAGEYFNAPFGATTTVETAKVFGYGSNTETETTLYGYAAVGNIIAATPTYSKAITLTTNTWNSIDLGADNWTFDSDFVLGVNVGAFSDTPGDTTYIYAPIDEAAIPSSNSWVNFGSWSAWASVATSNNLGDGEWGIRAVIHSTGGTAAAYNVYRDPGVNGSQWQLMFNGNNISTNEYTDRMLIENGIEYCYKVSAIFGTEESAQAGPVCATPESDTIYEVAYDDGSAETQSTVGILNFHAVKFTPFGYPADLNRTSIYTVGSTNGVGLIYVWDDDGENGLPGTILLEAIPVTFGGNTWKYFSLSVFDITITEGSFYIGVMETDETPDLGVDIPNPSTFSYISIDNTWYPFSDALANAAIMIRAELDSINALGIDDGLTGNIPESFGLKQNFPNPFNPTTTIKFDLASGAFASIILYDVTGREVKTLVNSNLQAGHYVFELNASDLPSGMYFYKLTAQNFDGQMIFSSTKKMVLMK